MQTQEIVSQPVHTVKAAASVQFAAEMMAMYDVGALPVTEDGRLVGIVTDRDIVLRCLAVGLSPTATEVEDIMTADPAALAPRADAEVGTQSLVGWPVHRRVAA
jgi:CBS domain-containing protein